MLELFLYYMCFIGKYCVNDKIIGIKEKQKKKFLEIYGNFIGGLRCGNEGQDKKKRRYGFVFFKCIV